MKMLGLLKKEAVMFKKYIDKKQKTRKFGHIHYHFYANLFKIKLRISQSFNRF